MSWKDKMYRVLFLTGNRAGQVGQLLWTEAEEQQEKGTARFLSNTLYKAVKANIDIAKIEKLDDKEIKAKIAEIAEKKRKSKEKQEKGEKKRERKRRGKKGEVKEEEKVTA